MKKKTIALLLVLVMIFGISVGGTIAYLTDKETVTNTFTVGDVQIKLDEAKVDETGTKIDNNGDKVIDDKDRVTSNDYKLLPGMSYTKDPAVTVLEGSEESYIRMIVTVTDCKDVDAAITEANELRANADPELPAIQLTDMFEGYDDEKWILKNETKTAIGNEGDYQRTYEFWYANPIAGHADNKNGSEDQDNNLEPLFTTLKVPGEIDNDSLAAIAEMTIVVEAHAMQAAGFDDAEDAWRAWTVNN